MTQPEKVFRIARVDVGRLVLLDVTVKKPFLRDTLRPMLDRLGFFAIPIKKTE